MTSDMEDFDAKARLVHRDMARAAEMYRTVPSDRKAILGGCFLSWASGVTANDYDIFVPKEDPVLSFFKNEGFVFTDRLSRYGTHRRGWLVSANRVTGWFCTQVILVPEEVWPVWPTFDYYHCMVGLVTEAKTDRVVNAGTAFFEMGHTVINAATTGARSFDDIKNKLKDKPAFGCKDYGIVQAVINEFHRLVSPRLEHVYFSTEKGERKVVKPLQAHVPPRTGLCYNCGTRGTVTMKSGVFLCEDC